MLYASNRRKSRRRRANSRRRRGLFGLNRRHRRSRRHRSYNRRRRSRRHRRNPGGALSIRRPLSSITAGFSPSVLMKAVPVVGGALGNAWLSGFLSSRLPLPGVLKSGPGSYVVSLGSAGLLGAGVGMIAPRYAGPVFFGGVLETVIRAAQQYVVGPLMSRMSGFNGFGDYLTVADAASARPLGSFGDYLTVADAASARPLGDFGDFGNTDSAISEELAAL